MTDPSIPVTVHRPSPASPPPSMELPAPHASSRITASAVLGVVGVAVLLLVGLVVAAYLVLSLGIQAVAICALLALIPLAGVLLAIRWVDRWEPEPRLALLFALLWGAAASVAIALLFDLVAQYARLAIGVPTRYTEFLQLAVQAPVVEESAKAIGLLLIFWVARRHFDGPVDGVVYGATIAAGFAFTENIVYFGGPLVSGTTGTLVGTFVLRGLFSPFAHVTFTMITGIAIGYGARRGPGAALGSGALGLVGAIVLHALWNTGVTITGDFLSFYVLLQVPIFAFLVTVVILLRRYEIHLTRRRLREYAAVGWFTPAEVEMLSTWQGRRRAR
ncbi:PrsW family intramembrane metalloprotease, partial [Clavibacter michiganensis]